MNRWGALVLLIAFAGALFLRLPRLDSRPLHNDEAVNAVKIAELWQEGRYKYDPDEYHGPTLHYFTLPFLWLSGASGPSDLPNQVLRHVTVFFGAALILLLPLFKGGLGWHAIGWAAVFTAISPAFVFYSRYFIHEMLLIFFTALAIGAGWRYFETRKGGWAALAGTGLGLMFATKETFVLSGAAMFVAGLVALRSAGHRISFSALRALIPMRHLVLFSAATLAVWLLFFTSFFTNFGGLIDSITTYFPWLKRASGHSPHIHPWYFYLERIGWFKVGKGPLWTEALILALALAGTALAFWRNRSPLLRFIAVYSWVLAAIYSAISYKTPWCLLGFYHGMILLAGAGAAALVEHFRARPLRLTVAALILACSAQLGVQAWRGSFTHSADRRNPYVYAQTGPDLPNLVNRIEGIAKVSPDGFKTIVKVMAPEADYWPLPWELRRFQQIGWYNSLPDDPYAPIIVAASELDARLDEKSERKWIMAGVTELRPGKFLELYVEIGLWTKYVSTLPPPVD